MEKYGIKRTVTCEMLDRHPEARSYVMEEMTRELVGEIVPELHEGEKIVKLSNVREFQERKDFQCMTVQLERVVTIESLIRCRDCKYLQVDEVFHQYWCNGKRVEPNHYCGYAKRRGDLGDF